MQIKGFETYSQAFSQAKRLLPSEFFTENYEMTQGD
jgi:hypothetical protein